MEVLLLAVFFYFLNQFLISCINKNAVKKKRKDEQHEETHSAPLDSLFPTDSLPA